MMTVLLAIKKQSIDEAPVYLQWYETVCLEKYRKRSRRDSFYTLHQQITEATLLDGGVFISSGVTRMPPFLPRVHLFLFVTPFLTFTRCSHEARYSWHVTSYPYSDAHLLYKTTYRSAAQ